MSVKMREEFEVRFPVPPYVFWCDKSQHYMNSGNPLGCLTYRGQWEGWQASRESLVIDLPAGSSLMGRMYGAEGGGVPLIERSIAAQAIEAAGLKVKS